MISVDEALERILALASAPRPEAVALSMAQGRVLCEPAIARLNQPPFDASAMDGYAMRMADLPGPLEVIGTSAAGHPWLGTARPHTAIRIFTGAPVPQGYDHVELQEHVLRDGDRITVETISASQNIRLKGKDFQQGDVIPAGTVMTPARIGLLASMNVPTVMVARRPLVAIMASGDELVALGTIPAPGQIIGSNDLALAALARDAGADIRILPVARDTEASLRDNFSAAADTDLLVTIGGASVGDHDLVGKVAQDCGMTQALYKVALRPGKPLIAGKMGAMAMIGLPGNPVSAMVCGILFMQPLIRAMQGLTPTVPMANAILSCDLPVEGARQHYMRATVTAGVGLPVITPFGDQDSARQSLLAQADGLLVRAPNDPARRTGDMVRYLPVTL